jgi:hypothetical protein
MEPRHIRSMPELRHLIRRIAWNFMDYFRIVDLLGCLAPGNILEVLSFQCHEMSLLEGGSEGVIREISEVGYEMIHWIFHYHALTQASR